MFGQVVIYIWAVCSFGAAFGAGILAYLAIKDTLKLRQDPAPFPPAHKVRTETAGILRRSGLLRSTTAAAFLLIDLPAIFHPVTPVPILAGMLSLLLIGATFYVTMRDLRARRIISENMSRE